MLAEREKGRVSSRESEKGRIASRERERVRERRGELLTERG